MTLLLFTLLFAVFYIQVGYACIMWLLARVFPKRLNTIDPLPDAITIVLCVHNGAAHIQQRLQNLADCEWVGIREFLVFCDGCDDDTATLASQSCVECVRVMSSPTQRGKWAALNDAIQAASHPVVVFADLRQTFDTQAIQNLTHAFRDPRVGAVSGLLEIAASDSGGGRGVDLYWRMERKLREWEARFDSVIGCTGAIYAIRKKAFQKLTPGTILDDVIVPMQIAIQGWRVTYNPQAIAFDPQRLDPIKEKSRKRRTLVGNYQMFELFPSWLLPWRNRLWWQLISHKYSRLFVPWMLMAILVLTIASLKTPLIWFLLGIQMICYALGIIGCMFPHFKSRLLTIPSGFLLLQVTCARALFSYVKCRRDPLSLWQPSQADDNPQKIYETSSQ
ncbi:glycosyltransferase [Prosthecobacter sp.]|jgi:cellulose synthase/poly-beta-1,6-N-acetylglucosamine synthase-like glycosyltransferase|uniref:glycosyltransferase n=1 Tax=Prosthecobacter sp. TaxID=1965333 RepID=UPI0037C5C66F